MSLYDDVEDGLGITNPPEADNAAKNEVANAWSNNSSFKLLQHQMEATRKRQQSQQASLAKREKMTASIAPVIDLNEKRRSMQEPLLAKRDADLNVSLSKYQSPTKEASSRIKTDESTSLSMFGGVKEEYDPMKPNDYDEIVEEMAKSGGRRKDESRGRHESGSRSSKHRGASDEENSGRKRTYSNEKDSDRDRGYRGEPRRSSSRNYGKTGGRSSDEEDDRDRSRRRSDDSHHHGGTKREAAFAPPPSLVEADSQTTVEANQEPINLKPTKTLFGGLMKAEKMMARMGYKEGDGLGRNNQGMSMALQVEKTGIRSGRIIHEKDAPPELPAPTTPTASAAAAPVVGISPEVMKNISKVVLLRNMVGPGDVDEELESETKEECQKYGDVNRVVIYEIPGQVPEEAVRIFVEFKTLPSAIKALTDLNGRFFGGRVVKATFYNLDKFNKLELGEDV